MICPCCNSENTLVFFAGEMDYGAWLKLQELVPALSEEIGYCGECGAFVGVTVKKFNKLKGDGKRG
jgi:hypothetical protein